MKGHALTAAGHFLRARWRFRRLRGQALIRYQDRLARRIVEYACQHSPYYADLYAGRRSWEWRTLPTSDKQAMMANFDHFNTRGVRGEVAMAAAVQAETSRDFSPTVGDLTVGLSSGTSGHRGLFLVSPWEQAAWAGVIIARMLPPFRLKGFRVALFHRSNSNLYEQLGSRWLELRYYDLMLPLKDAVAALNQYQPDILVGPPSLLRLLARQIEEGRLKIKPLRIYSAAEVLEPQDRDRIEEGFELPVGQIYQCTEGLLAVTCTSMSLHIQEDLVVIQEECLPSGNLNGGPSPSGTGSGSPDEDGEARMTPVVTDLWRRVQPIIRYRLNDVLTLNPEPCPCGSGFRIISRVEGRCDDLLYFPTPEGSLRPFFPDTIRRIVLLSSREILDYRACQENPGHLHVHLESSPGADFGEIERDLRARMGEALAYYGCCPARVEVENGIPPETPGAKRRRVRRMG